MTPDTMEIAFLGRLEEDEDDNTTRLVYADWLDERGEHEEAERQRKWQEAKEWLMDFVSRYNPDPSDPDPYESYIGYKDLLESGEAALLQWQEGDRDPSFHVGSNMSMQDGLHGEREDFWRNWSIVTGKSAPPEFTDAIQPEGSLRRAMSPSHHHGRFALHPRGGAEYINFGFLVRLQASLARGV